MTANSPTQETSLTDQAVAWLQTRLPGGWEIEASDFQAEQDQLRADARINLRGPNGTISTVIVEEKQSVSPRSVLSQLSPRIKTARSMGAHLPLLVIAPWLSERTQELLAKEDINYLDLTGNAQLRIDNPPFFMQTTGAQRNPSPPKRAGAKLRGAKASRVIRLLLDVHPPYGVLEITEATGLNRGYVSRLLEALYRDGLIEREPRGPVESVDVPALVRRWVESYDTFRTNGAEGFIVAAGLERLLTRLAADPGLGTRAVITGSFAANRLAPIASPALLLLYYDSPQLLAAELDLLPAQEGANVMILKPFDPVVFDRTRIEEGLRYAAPSQIAVDCLGGNGRMPAEGEALLEWMAAEESSWRLSSLEDLYGEQGSDLR
ncbi:MAG TPA: helix-turn-helix domain-containing protein [Solirubrobacterales bacterium]|nr:helix-turn-helix domain-containing protein [Solirubrobacterales bacterium]